MNTYHIARDGDRFRVIESFPDGGTGSIGHFTSETDAQSWIDDYIQMRAWPKDDRPEQ